MKRKRPRHMQEWHDALLAAGFEYLGRGNGGHHKYRHPDGRSTVFPSSPSDWRANRNTTARIKRLTAM